jgi:hypothetical protein
LLMNFFRSCESVGAPEVPWFQQDGAPAHTAATTVQYLNQVFGKHWIGKGSDHEWPPGSPDLTVPDYWLWSRLLKDINECAP